jgi:hypothetical protein
VLWLDGLVMNPDRTIRNANILFWRQRPWLIDHGAALTFQHHWPQVTEDSPRERTDYCAHVFGNRISLLQDYDASLARSLSRQDVEAAIEQVPDGFLTTVNPETTGCRCRAAYHAFLWKRLKSPRPFVDTR